MIACIPLLVDYLVLGTDSVQCLRETEYMLQGEWGRIPAAIYYIYGFRQECGGLDFRSQHLIRS